VPRRRPRQKGTGATSRPLHRSRGDDGRVPPAAASLERGSLLNYRAVAIPADVRAKAEAALSEFCEQHSSAPGADRLRYVYQFEPNAAVLLEQRPGFMNPDDWVARPIAKFRYSEARNTWALYWSDANGKWHRVSDTKADSDIRAMLRFVISDPLGVFWS
jgi:hypothetical protein